MSIKKLDKNLWTLKIDELYLERSTKRQCMNELEYYTKKKNEKLYQDSRLSRHLSRQKLKRKLQEVK